ncbi:MAG TPA: D-2-hydroxyacid dehydrogenase [Cyclobacteriaceae bacterium]|nr:D-2-hydroxyacid dehydrogenase [Cyclobacteriaceae bacterium]
MEGSPRIVILDGYTLNPGDLSWGMVEEFGEATIYDRTDPEQILKRISDAEVVLTNKVSLSRDAIMHAPFLQYIGVTATGYNIVDVKAAKERKIIVTNVPAYGTASVAQHAFALLLELASHVGLHAMDVRQGGWSSQGDFCYWKKPLVELHGKTFGIVGLGKIGKAVARIALGFGMHVLAVHKHPERDRMDGVSFTDIDTLFREADVVSLHCPLNDDNKAFVNRDLLAVMKPTSFFLNVSRGGLVNENDLAGALNDNVIAGAGLDVLSVEPPPFNNPLLGAKNCIITPHQAWAAQASRSRLMNVAINNLKAFLEGHPQNVVS